MIKKFSIGLLLLSIIFMAVSCNKKSTTSEIKFGSAKLSVAGYNLSVEVADTEPARNQGLSNRDSLPENNGMLFIFPEPGRYAFWMKDTKIALDFIWLKDGKVVEVSPSVQPQPGLPEAALHTYLPQQIIDSMIEVNAGWAAKNKIKVGDKVDRS